jgi:cytoskeletal protein RodZ
MYPARKKTSAKHLTRTIIMVLCGLAVLVIIGVRLYMLHRAVTPPKTIPPVSASQSTKGDTQPSLITSPTPSSTQSADGTPQSNKDNTAQGATLIQPTGNFVSNHKNVPASTSLSSVCNTTAGATCQIVFSSGSMTYSLPIQTADLGGTAYWSSWTPASIGLSPGTWQITAVATLAGNTKSSPDALGLEVIQ